MEDLRRMVMKLMLLIMVMMVLIMGFMGNDQLVQGVYISPCCRLDRECCPKPLKGLATKP